MTVSSSTNRVSYSGNGTLTTFAYTFKVFDQGDLTVILRSSTGTETVQTITTHYTVTGVGDVGGGNVVFVTAPSATETVVILREQDLTQGLDLVPNDPFPAQSLEESLDKLTFMVQQHEEELGRAIKASRTNTLTGSEFTISAADRANKVFSFDSSGDLSVTQELGTFKGDWAASTAYVERDLVKDTTTNNVFIVTSAHTSSGSLPLTTNTNSAKYEKIIDITNPPGDVTFGGSITTSSSVTAGSFVIGSADINENDLEAIDSVTAGTVAASKAVVVDVNKDISSFRNLTATGDITFGGLSDGTITVTAFVDEDNMASDSATLVPTQQSVKAYVDSQIGANDALSEILGNGNTSGGTNIQMTTTDELQFRDTALKISSSVDGQLDIDADTKVEITAPTVDINATNANFTGHALFGDDDRIKFGDSQDAYLEWTSVGYFTARSTGRFDIQSDGNDLRLVSNTNIGLTVNHTGGTPAVHLYNSGTERLATTSTGIDVTGTITSDAIAIDTDVLYVDSTNDRVGINTTSPDRDLTVIGTGHFGATTAGVALSNSASVGVIYGMTSTGSAFTDLQITSVGSASHLYFDADGTIAINNTSPNDWVSTGTQFVIGGGSGHNGMTIASGSTSYGTIYFADGTTGDALDAGYIRYHHQYDRMSFVTSSSSTDAIRITSAGDVGIGLTGDPSTKLDVNGTVTATGGAFTGDVTFGDDDKAIFGAGSDLQIYHDGTGSKIYDSGTGNLQILGDSDVYIANANNSEYKARFITNGAVELYYDAVKKFETTSTGVDITGTLTSDGLTVDGTTAIPVVIDSNQTDTAIQFKNSGYDDAFIEYNDNNLFFYTDNKRFLSLASNGDISFYEDTGTTAKFFWDASAESLGIGTSSPSANLNIFTSGIGLRIDADAASGDAEINLAPKSSSSGTCNVSIVAESEENGVASALYFKTRTSGGTNSERMRIDSSGNVGIGTSSPASKFQVKQSAVADLNGLDGIRIEHSSGSTTAYAGLGLTGTDLTIAAGNGSTNNNNILFRTAASGAEAERMRIDSSGNLLVGRTSNNWTTAAGFTAQSNGAIIASRADTSGFFNRLTTDGSIVNFAKDGSTVGTIATHDTRLAIGSDDTYIMFDSGTSPAIWPSSGTAGYDNAIDIGDASRRFKDLYLSGGVYLGGTGAANKLDDYEEGTFTPQIADAVSGGNSTTTGSTIAGHYVKVGDLVHVSVRIIFPNTSGLTSGNVLYIRNLPFTCYNANGGFPLAVGTSRNINYSYDMITAQISPNTTFLNLESCRAASLSSPLAEEELTCGQFSGDGTSASPVLYLGGTYRTT